MKIENLSISTEDIIRDMVNTLSNDGIKGKIPSQTKNQAPWFDKRCRELKKAKVETSAKF